MSGNPAASRPIFITGLYRSGTTLVSRLLNNHSRLRVTYDSVHFMRFCFGRYDPIGSSENARALVDEVYARINGRWGISFDREEVLCSLGNSGAIEYAEIYGGIMRSLLLIKGGGCQWGEKTNICWGRIPSFLEMFPNGKAIHVLRDPRDSLASFKFFTKEPGLRYMDAVFAGLDSFQAALNFRLRLPRTNYHVIKYEELLLDPPKELALLCEFLGVDYEPELLDTSRFTDKQGGQWKGESAFGPCLEGISTDSMGRWKNKLSRGESFLCELVMREVMLEFGYKIDAGILSGAEWIEFGRLLEDVFVRERFRHFLLTGKGREAYPSDPILWSEEQLNGSEERK